MPLANVAKTTITVARTVHAGYKILATIVLGYYLIKETIQRERYGRKSAGSSRGYGAK